MMTAKRELTPVPFGKVRVDGPFWARRVNTNIGTTIPSQYSMLKETGLIDSLRSGWDPGSRWLPHYFAYETIYKWIEAASYSLVLTPDENLRSLVKHLVGLIREAQEPDGYVRWSFNADSDGRGRTHSDGLYCGGHLIEAGVTHFEATGEPALLEVSRRYADYIATVFGVEAGRERGYAIHPGVETSLVRLYRATGVKKYAELAKFFVDERGRRPHYLDGEARKFGKLPVHYWAGTFEYNQSHKPVREQTEVVGHAVMAMYLFCGLADVAEVFGDEGLRRTLDGLWDDLLSKRMYITGGLGAGAHNEGFTNAYDLPNATAYAETCAAIGLIFWAHRMLQFECDGRFADAMERALYNGVLSGISLDGKKYFYENPLASQGSWERRPWYGCPCCPPNIARLIASLGRYAYSESQVDAIVHLYIGGTALFGVAGQAVELRVETRYPWDGKVIIAVVPQFPASFGIKLRVPGWCRKFTIAVNGEEVTSSRLTRGYVRLEREWRSGDRIELEFAMPVELVTAHPDVTENRGCVAIARGPVIYCLEQVDNDVPPGLGVPVELASLDERVPLGRIVIPLLTQLEADFKQDLLGGVVVVHGNALYDLGHGSELYRPSSDRLKPFRIMAVPYFAWNNRDRGEMRVWIRSA